MHNFVYRGRPQMSTRKPKPLATLYAALEDAVRTVPRGRVATYGEIAASVGISNGGRLTAAALKRIGGRRVPWWRIVGAHTRTHVKIAILDPMGAAMQRARLEGEGVEVDEKGRIKRLAFGWRSQRLAGRQNAAKSRT